MGKEEMDALRRRLYLDPRGKVSVAFEQIEDGSHRAAFRCETCDELLRWQAASGWWACATCQYELRPAEAVDLLDTMRRALRTLHRDAKRKAGRRWVWGS